MQEAHRSQISRHADQQQVTNARTGKVERVFVDLRAVYPNDDDPYEELSFEEVRAHLRGWLDKDWMVEYTKIAFHGSSINDDVQQASYPIPMKTVKNDLDPSIADDYDNLERLRSGIDLRSEPKARETKAGRPKKIRKMEVKAETQTSKPFKLQSVATC